MVGIVLGHRPVRALVAASTIGTLAEATVWVAVLVHAFDVAGPAVAGAVAALQLLPAGAVALVGGPAADRSASQVLTWGLAGMAGLATAGAAVIWWVPDLWPVVVLGVGVAVGFAVVRPAITAAVPAVSPGPAELVAANGLIGAGEALAWVLGPLLAAALVPLGVAVVGVIVAVGFGLAALMARVVGPTTVPARPRRGSASLVAQVIRLRPARVLLGIGTLVQFVLGALEVVVVAVALDGLSMGEAGAGLLLAAQGIGGVVGAVVVARLVAHDHLAGALVAGAAVFGVPIALLGVVPGILLAVLSLVLAGVGEMTMDVVGRTLLQRTAPPHLMARAFGVVEGLRLWALAAGAAVAGAGVAVAGADVTALVLGVVVPVAVLAGLRPIRAVAGAGVDPEWVRSIMSLSMCSSLSLRAVEGVATAAVEVSLPVGATPIVEGETGDHLLGILSGAVVVSRGGIEVARLGPGDHVGEIALLRHVPRTATVTVVEAANVVRIDRDDFLEAVLDNPVAVGDLDDGVERRLDGLAGLEGEGS